MTEPVERVLKRLSSFELKRGESASAGDSLAKTGRADDATGLDDGTPLSPFNPAQAPKPEEKPELPEQGRWERFVKRRISTNNSQLAGFSDPNPARSAFCNESRVRTSPLSGLSGAELTAKMDLLHDTERQLLAELRALRRDFNEKMMALADVRLPQAFAPHAARTAGQPPSSTSVACSEQLQPRRPSATCTGGPAAATATATQQAVHRPPLSSALGRQHQPQQQLGRLSNGMQSVQHEGAWSALQSAAAAASAAGAVSTNGAWMMPPPPRGRAVPRLPVRVGALLPPQPQPQLQLQRQPPQRQPPQHQPPQHRRLPPQQQHRQLLQLQQAIELQRAAAMAEAMMAAGRAARASADGSATGGVGVRRRNGGV